MLSFAVFVSQNSLAFPYSSFPRPLFVSNPRSRLRSGGSSARQLCLCSGRASARRPFPRPRHAASSNPCFSPFSFHRSRSAPNLFRIRIYEKSPCKPFGIRSFKTRHLKSFRIRSYEKTGGAPLSIQNRLTRFGKLCRRVCPFASFGYNARPFAREVNR
jgi:hypothetical protein